MYKYAAIIASLIIPSVATAERELTTLWRIKVINSEGEKSYIPAKTRTHIPATTCDQQPVSRSTANNGDVVEYIQINGQENA